MADKMRGIDAYNMSKHEKKVEFILRLRDDHIHGLTKTEIKRKFYKGEYGVDPTQYKDGGKTFFMRCWKEMTDTYLEDFGDEERAAVRDQILAKYMHLYRLFMARDEVNKAKAVLDSIGKFAGLDQQDAKVSFAPGQDGKVEITFGYSDN